MGIRQRWDQAGHPERRLWVVGGDGAMYDIGFQSLSRMVASGADIKAHGARHAGLLEHRRPGLDGHRSAGRSPSSRRSASSSTAARSAARSSSRILLAHGDVYVAQTTPAHINHFYRAVMEANEYPGPAVIVVYTPCQPEHGIADDASNRQARLAVDSRAFPLFTYDPRKGESIAERLSLQGNPAVKEDWSKNPDGTPFDFLAFARTEGRFAPHFGAAGEPSVEILATQADRLANWHGLQELAGIR